MTVAELRRQAFEAQQRAAAAADAFVKAEFDRLAQQWLALADQAEWLEQRYGSAVSGELRQAKPQAEPLVAQQQQQIQPKDENGA